MQRPAIRQLRDGFRQWRKRTACLHVSLATVCNILALSAGRLLSRVPFKDKLPGMSEEEMLRLLAADGMLVKRPLLVGDDLVLVGFKEAEWERALKAQ